MRRSLPLLLCSALAAAALTALGAAPASAATGVPGDPLTGSGKVARSILTDDELASNAANPVPGGSPSIGTTLIFRDSGGRWWRRHGAEPVRHVHDDPENSGPTRGELESAAAVVQAMGWEPSPPAKVPLRAKFWRTVRRVRGLSPTP